MAALVPNDETIVCQDQRPGMRWPNFFLSMSANQGRQSIDLRIVNIAQPYVRPIVRGKAGRTYSCGATVRYLKVNI